MGSPKSMRIPNAAKRRELEIAAAVAREKIIQFHVTTALRVIGLAADRVSPIRMLEIHLRLHRITGPEAELLAYRVLAAIGETAGANTARLFIQGEDAPPAEAASLWRVLRDRLRGRIHHDLRRWVELATGAAQAGLIDIHVQHAVRFAKELTETHSVAQSAAVYAEMVDMPPTLREAFVIRLADRVAADELPRSATPAPQERVTEESVNLSAGRLYRRQVI
ncbi:MAG TPA: hypothetical protein VK939_10770 [Longimicrobiales bacterium]|nr:hypothetical protein [Longimicrobiales bacterium]